MKTLLSDRLAPITSAIGFLERDLDEVAGTYLAWRRQLGQRPKARRVDGRFPEVLRELEPLTGGAVPRVLLVEAGRWTAYFDCALHGTDPFSFVVTVGRMLSCRGVVVVVVPHTAGPREGSGGRLGARQFELYGPEGDSVDHIRTLAVTHAGVGWRFDAAGELQAFEEPERYEARRVSDRLTSDMIERYCRALGIDVFEPSFYGPRALFVDTRERVPKEGYIMSLGQVQEWLDIKPGEADALAQ